MAIAFDQKQETRQAPVSYVNRQDYDGRTALHHAATHGHMTIVVMLLSHGADASIRDKFGQSAADVARDNGHLEVSEYIISYCC
jgi:ankyrin repeat protein